MNNINNNGRPQRRRITPPTSAHTRYKESVPPARTRSRLGSASVKSVALISAAAVVIVCAVMVVIALVSPPPVTTLDELEASTPVSSSSLSPMVGAATAPPAPITSAPAPEDPTVSDDPVASPEPSDAAPSASAATPSGDTIYKLSMKDPEIKNIQSRLMELGYMPKAETTDLFGPATESAVKAFQANNGLTADGILGPSSYEKLFSDDAKKASSSSSSGTLKLTDKNDEVKKVQEQLKKLNYLTSGATGYFGTDTEKAVKEFQENNGLTVDGSVGPATKEKLFSADAKAKQ